MTVSSYLHARTITGEHWSACRWCPIWEAALTVIEIVPLCENDAMKIFGELNIHMEFGFVCRLMCCLAVRGPKCSHAHLTPLLLGGKTGREFLFMIWPYIGLMSQACAFEIRREKRVSCIYESERVILIGELGLSLSHSLRLFRCPNIPRSKMHASGSWFYFFTHKRWQISKNINFFTSKVEKLANYVLSLGICALDVAEVQICGPGKER